MPRDYLSQRTRLRNSLVDFLNDESKSSITLHMTRDQFEHLVKDYPDLEATKKGPITGSYKYECTFKKRTQQ